MSHPNKFPINNNKRCGRQKKAQLIRKEAIFPKRFQHFCTRLKISPQNVGEKKNWDYIKRRSNKKIIRFGLCGWMGPGAFFQIFVIPD